MFEDNPIPDPDDFLSQDSEGIDGLGFDGDSQEAVLSLEGYTYDTLIGFDEEIRRMRESGLIGDTDEEFLAFVRQMQEQHGMHDEAVGTSILFRSDVRDDADRFMLATAHELGRPTLRLRVMDAPSGMHAICVVATPGVSEEGFDDWGTLVIEGIDLLEFPFNIEMGLAPLGTERDSDHGPSKALNGVIKTMNLIRKAAVDPKVAVFASSCVEPDAASPLMRLVGPMRVFNIPAPCPEERDAIWDHLMSKHVSLSALDRFELVRLSASMPRCDIFAAAHEAVAQAYHQSIDTRKYVPVASGNLLDKIAAYQPLDSKEYREIEDRIVEDFLADIDRYERGVG